MTWDFVESNPLSQSSGGFSNAVDQVIKSINLLPAYAGSLPLIVGNYLTTNGRPPEADHALLEALGMPVAEGPGEGRFVVDATGSHALPAKPVRTTIPVTTS